MCLRTRESQVRPVRRMNVTVEDQPKHRLEVQTQTGRGATTSSWSWWVQKGQVGERGVPTVGPHSDVGVEGEVEVEAKIHGDQNTQKLRTGMTLGRRGAQEVVLGIGNGAVLGTKVPKTRGLSGTTRGLSPWIELPRGIRR